MYKLIEKTLGLVKISEKLSVVCKTIDVENRIFSISNLESKAIDMISLPRLWTIGLTERFMLVSYYNDITEIYSKEDFCTIFTFSDKLTFNSLSEDNIYIYICLNGIMHIYNKLKNTLNKFDTGESRNFYCAHGNIVLFAESDNRINLCKILDNSIESIWRIDAFNDLFPGYKRKDEFDRYFTVYQVKVYNGDFIVATTGGIARLDAKTGETIWKTECRYSSSVEIVGNIGYVGKRGALCKIDLDNGKLSGYGWENDVLPQIEYSGQKYWAHGGSFVYNDGLLWHSVNMSGKSFIVAIDPKDGSYVWVERVDSEHIYEPQFHDDKMYITDINGNLFIYQKQD